MNSALAEMLSRLHDGESVDPDIVADALESPEGRRVFVDYVRLTAAARADQSEPSDAFYQRMGRTLQPSVPRSSTYRVLLRSAAALLLAALLGGAGVESWRRWRAERPPVPARVLRFEPSEWTTGSRSGS